MLAAAAVGIVLVAGGIAAGIALTSGSGKTASETTVATTTTNGTTTQTTTGVTTLPAPIVDAPQVQSLLHGIPQHGFVLGKPSAPVRLIEYADIQCPYCRDAEANTITDVIQRYVRTGKTSLELRLLASIGSDSVRGRTAAFAAAEQNKMFNLITLLYRNQGEENTGWLTNAEVRRAAQNVPGLNVQRMIAAMGTPAVASEGRLIDAAMARDNVTETPTFFVGRRGGRLERVTLQSSTDTTSLPIAIDAAGT